MISVGFQRITKKRPCRICGKPTYRGFSRDEGISICMRISVEDRDTVNRHILASIAFCPHEDWRGITEQV
jgi:hypothetical protein